MIICVLKFAAVEGVLFPNLSVPSFGWRKEAHAGAMLQQQAHQLQQKTTLQLESVALWIDGKGRQNIIRLVSYIIGDLFWHH